MTFYKLWAGKVLDSREDEADYIKHDLEYFRKFVQDQGFEELEWDVISTEIDEWVNERKEPSKDTKKLITSMLIGDSDINEPMGSWFIFPGNMLMDFVEYNWFHSLREMSREYGDHELISVPEYSTPQNIKNMEESYELPFKPLRYKDSRDCIIMTTGMIDLEWAEYILNQMNLNFDRDKIQNAREEFLKYFSEDESLSEDSTEVFTCLKECDKIWIQGVKDRFNVDSILMSWVLKSNRKFVKNLAAE